MLTTEANISLPHLLLLDVGNRITLVQLSNHHFTRGDVLNTTVCVHFSVLKVTGTK